MYKIEEIRIMAGEGLLDFLFKRDDLNKETPIIVDSFEKIDKMVKNAYTTLAEEIPQDHYDKLYIELDIIDTKTKDKITLHPRVDVSSNGYNPFIGVRLKDYIQDILQIEGSEEEIDALFKAIETHTYSTFLLKMAKYVDIPLEKQLMFKEYYYNSDEKFKKYFKELEERNINIETAMLSLFYFIERKSKHTTMQDLNDSLFEKCFIETINHIDAIKNNIRNKFPNQDFIEYNTIFQKTILENLFKEKLDLAIKETKNPNLKKYRLFMLSYFAKTLEYEFNDTLPIFEENRTIFKENFSQTYKILSTNWNYLLTNSELDYFDNFSKLLNEKLDGALDFYKTLKNAIENGDINDMFMENQIEPNLKIYKEQFQSIAKESIITSNPYSAINLPMLITYGNTNEYIRKQKTYILSFSKTINEFELSEEERIKLNEMIGKILQTLEHPITQEIIDNYIKIGEYTKFLKDFNHNKIEETISELQRYIDINKEKEFLILDIMLDAVEILETKNFTYDNKKEFLHMLSASDIEELQIVKHLSKKEMIFFIKNSNAPLDVRGIIDAAREYVKGKIVGDGLENDKNKDIIEDFSGLEI